MNLKSYERILQLWDESFYIYIRYLGKNPQFLAPASHFHIFIFYHSLTFGETVPARRRREFFSKRGFRTQLAFQDLKHLRSISRPQYCNCRREKSVIGPKSTDFSPMQFTYCERLRKRVYARLLAKTFQIETRNPPLPISLQKGVPPPNSEGVGFFFGGGEIYKGVCEF